jgi:hypothetical protein
MEDGMRLGTLCAAAIVILAASVQSNSAPVPGSEIAVRVARTGDTFTIEADWSVAASADAVWDVLTDFDRMALIVSSVDASRIINRNGNRFEVEQKSHADVGLLRISRDSLRQVELLPKREIRSRLLKGDLKSSDFTTRITEEAGAAKVSVRGTFVTTGLAGAVITAEAVQLQTQRAYQELREEILRRKAHEPPPPCLLAKTCPQG